MAMPSFREQVIAALFRRVGCITRAHLLAREASVFIKYCNEAFTNYNPERCALGILAKVDSQRHPERYGNMNMNSCFDTQLVAGYYMKNEGTYIAEDLIARIKEE